MTDWQPISTAPRDGTLILCWGNHFYHVASFGWWDEGTDDLPVWFNGDVVVEPTHWQPLPDPPASTGAG